MKKMTIERIVSVCNGRYFGPGGCLTEEVSSIYTDSRKIEKDSLFVPIKGEHVDGHDFIEQVFENGAMLSLSEHRLDTSKPYVLVESTLQALKDLAEYYLKQLNIPVVGVTGSVGKTSTKEMIASVLQQKYCTLKTDGNYNNEIGLPLTVFRLRGEHEVAVLEMGISDFGEMSRLTKIARPDIAVITNIGWCHLEQLKDRDGVLKAKTEIFQGLKENGTILLNGEDDKLSTVREYHGITPVLFGYDRKHDIYAERVEKHGLKGTTCIIHTRKGSIAVKIPVPGIHMVMNAMAACGVGLAMGLTLDEIRRGIEGLQSLPGRMNLLYEKNYTIMDDCYNASPAAMKASIDILMEAHGRKVCILGDMGELGEKEAEFHRDMGRYIAQKDVDVLITIGELSRYISEEAQKKEGILCRHFAEKKEAIEQLSHILAEGDSILVKASHFMGFSDIVNALKEQAG